MELLSLTFIPSLQCIQTRKGITVELTGAQRSGAERPKQVGPSLAVMYVEHSFMERPADSGVMHPKASAICCFV
jgi:hypothetical protein